MQSCVLARAQQKLRADLLKDADREIRRCAVVHGNNHHATSRASEESSDPLGAILSPEHHPVALADVACFQFARETNCHFQDLAVGKPLHPVAPVLAVGAVVRVRPKILRQKFG